MRQEMVTSISGTGMTEPVAARELLNPVSFVALGFGSGLAPVAPGTAGTLAAIPLYLLVQDLPLAAYLGVLAAMLLGGVPVCGCTAGRLGVHDHPAIVWDEVVGYLVTMIAAPAGWLWVAAGFVLFRLFDILKPWPIRWFDRHVHGGAGIMLDDVIAGVLAAAVLQGAAYLV
jgi:phosphatidylglycerophosphatase A